MVGVEVLLQFCLLPAKEPLGYLVVWRVVT